MEMSHFGDRMSQAVTFLEQHDVEVPFLFFAQLPKKERKEKIKNWDGKQQGQSGKKQGWGWGSAWMGEPVTARRGWGSACAGGVCA